MPGHDTMAAVPRCPPCHRHPSRVRRAGAARSFRASRRTPWAQAATRATGPGLTYSFGELTFADHWRDIALALAIAARRGRRSGPRAIDACWARAWPIGLAGLALTPVAVAQERTDTVSAATDRAIRIGMSRDEVRGDRPVAQRAAERRCCDPGKRLRCLVYLGASYDRYLYCFAGDRLVEKR